MRFKLVVLLSFIACLGIFAQSAQAAALPYQAEVSSGAVTIEKGQTKLITLKFKNIGEKTWYPGKDKVAVYLYGDSTIFGHTSWLANDLPKLIEQSSVKPGSMASASFYVKAPSTPGVYKERFLLSYGPNQWIKDSVVSVTFTVVEPTSAPAPKVEVSTAVPSSYNYQAELIDIGGIEWQIKPGEHVIANIKFKNIGKKTWVRDGSSYVSLYTWEPKYRKSGFQDFSWKQDSQAGFLVEAEVKPGQIGTFKMELRAPDAPGKYSESFRLAAENTAWVEGGVVSLPITVPSTNETISSGIVQGSLTADPGTYQATLLLNSFKDALRSEGNGQISITQGFKNAGTAVWNERVLRLVSVSPALGTASVVRDTTWPSTTEALKANGTPTAPGQLSLMSYTIKAPAKSGSYVVKFQLTADGQEIEGGLIEIPLTVTSDGYFDPTPISVPGPVATGEPLPLTTTLPEEPIMRVGVLDTEDDTMMVRGIQGGMKAMNNGKLICTFKQGDVAVVKYLRANGVYKISGPGCVSQSPVWYVLEAEDGIAPLEMTDFSRPIAWLAGSNDNKFRAKLELRYTPKTDKVWVINELPLEHYLYGIAETSDVSPMEYQKALLTAARTYALYHVNRKTKHADEFFYVDAKYDQVYRGYGQEARSPTIVDGVKQTKGYIVTYNGELAITPYFSRSDGRTRNWTDVWGGSGYPWLVAVPVPHDVGQTMWGHGVGLSARGALYMASKDAAKYDEILKHFYQGVEIRKAYK
ncbi:MAG: SpoIID/LytB domain-containing protein [Patescibacteria group bacterium]|nr:hypothetical protein [Patescibacteria group bacterium]MBU2509278.1 hypothetical protein [Patescibacteria group bacterium]